MKKLIRAVICITLALSLTFGASAASMQGIGDTFTSFFDGIVRFFSIVFGDISDILAGGYTRINIDEYTDFAFDIPGLGSGFVPQGLCYSDELGMFLISGYTNDGNSRIYAVDAEANTTKEIILKDFTAHAGGISVKGNNIRVASGGNSEKGGYLYQLSADDIIKAKSGDELAYDDKFQVPVKGSFLGCSDDMIWVGEFYTKSGGYEVNPAHAYGKNHSWACGYSVDSEGKLKLETVISVPDEVQGMSVLPDKTVIFSTSYGRYNDSALQIYAPYTEWSNGTVNIDGEDVPFYGCDKSDRVAKVEMPTLMQGIEIVDEKLCVIYESGAEKYSDAKEVIPYAQVIDIEAVLEQVS